MQDLGSRNLLETVDTVNKGEVFDNLINSLKESVQVTKENAKSLIVQIMKDNISFVP